MSKGMTGRMSLKSVEAGRSRRRWDGTRAVGLVAAWLMSAWIACCGSPVDFPTEEDLRMDLSAGDKGSAWTTPLNPASWMGALYLNAQQVRLRDVIIPGTHDSATSGMTDDNGYAQDTPAKIGHHTVYLWSKAQTYGMYDQLSRGIRYVDLRVEKNKWGWMTFHGLTSDMLTQVIDEIGKFAKEHPREIVLVDFQTFVHFDTAEHDKLAQYLRDHKTLGPRIAWGDFFDAKVSFEALWKADRNVILLSDLAMSPGLFWPRSVLQSPWPNTRHTEKVKAFLLSGICSRPANGFYVSQAIVTPDAAMFVGGIFKGILSLFDMAVKWMNPELDRLIPNLNDQARTCGRTLNIVIVDFFERSDLVDSCLYLNRVNLGLTN